MEKSSKARDKKIDNCMLEVDSLKAHTETDIRRIREELVDVGEKLRSLNGTSSATFETNSTATSAKYIKREEVQELLREQQDAASRASNVILFGVPESVGDIVQTCRKMLMEPGVSLPDNTSIERIGKTTHNTNDSRPRPIRIRTSKSVKDSIFQHKFQIRFRDRPIYIGHDLTPKQQAARKAVLPLFRTMRSNKVACSLPYDQIVQGGVPLTDERLAEILHSNA